MIEKGTSMALGIELSGSDFSKYTPGEKLFSFDRSGYNIEENQDIPVRSSLHQKTSDVVGQAFLKVSDNLNLNATFLDHNMSDINYNDFEANLILKMLTLTESIWKRTITLVATTYIKRI